MAYLVSDFAGPPEYSRRPRQSDLTTGPVPGVRELPAAFWVLCRRRQSTSPAGETSPKRFLALLGMTGKQGRFQICHSEERSDEESFSARRRHPLSVKNRRFLPAPPWGEARTGETAAAIYGGPTASIAGFQHKGRQGWRIASADAKIPRFARNDNNGNRVCSIVILSETKWSRRIFSRADGKRKACCGAARFSYLSLLLVQFEDSHEGFGGKLDGAEGVHLFLADPQKRAFAESCRSLSSSGGMDPPCAILRFAPNVRRKRRTPLCGVGRRRKSCAAYSSSSLRTAMKASVGSWTEPRERIFFLPSFCFSSSFFLRVISPP